MIPHVNHNSGENEWYTPPRILSSARKVLGSIDLDPASSDVAQEMVRATTYYSIKNNGLTKDWSGRVWLNPPYSKGLLPEFISKLCYHIENKDIEQAILLVNNATETPWFQKVLRICSAICFHKSRIRFISVAKESYTPLQGQAIFYFVKPTELAGSDYNRDRFIEEFSKYGIVLSHTPARLIIQRPLPRYIRFGD